MSSDPGDLTTIDLTAVRTRVDEAVERLVAGCGRRFGDLSPDLTAMSQALLDFCRGGKRIRPLFGYAAWRAAGGSREFGDQVAIDALSALELVQAAALIHDDIIDESDSRRGNPSIHAAFATAHRSAGMLGDSEKHGAAAAILLGDVALVWADVILHGAGLPGHELAAVRREFDQMRTEVLAGQYLDVLEQARPALPEDAMAAALRIAELKSASYTVARPMLIGAMMARADERVITAYRSYGHHLGIAFQLRDDVLGVYGEPGQTGKPAGDDLREGKRTALIARGRARLAGRPEAALLDEIGAPGLDQRQIDRIADLLRECGALDDVEVLIAEHATTAHDSIVSVDLAPAGRDALTELIELATARSH